MKPRPTIPDDELPLASAMAHTVFPGRTVLYIHEVAKALCITPQQVFDLIQEHEDTGGKSGLAAVNTGNSQRSEHYPKGTKSGRKNWRVPVSAYDDFITRRKNS